MLSKGKVVVSERALFARISRSLQKEDMVLHRCREDSGSFHTLGRYYAIDLRSSAVFERDMDLERFGREHGLLAEYEVLAD